MDKEYRRANFMLRLPHEMAQDIRHQAWQRGISANAHATSLLRYAMAASNDQVTLRDRLAMMGGVK